MLSLWRAFNAQKATNPLQKITNAMRGTKLKSLRELPSVASLRRAVVANESKPAYCPEEGFCETMNLPLEQSKCASGLDGDNGLMTLVYEFPWQKDVISGLKDVLRPPRVLLTVTKGEASPHMLYSHVYMPDPAEYGPGYVYFSFVLFGFSDYWIRS